MDTMKNKKGKLKTLGEKKASTVPEQVKYRHTVNIFRNHLPKTKLACAKTNFIGLFSEVWINFTKSVSQMNFKYYRGCNQGFQTERGNFKIGMCLKP